MTAAVINLVIEAGATFRQQFKWTDPDEITPIDMTGCSAFAEFRTTIDSTEILLALSTVNNKIQIDVPTGVITFHLTAAETALITWASAVYDLEIHFPIVGTEVPIYRIAKGKVKILKEVTRGI